ncbi:unnamed protein product [Durusdinium trenchii]|uniref:Calmodulin n=1 Tax=Durusdinium trenchii TaxID=1381693 RepID=A0ABP0KET5_9DINO
MADKTVLDAFNRFDTDRSGSISRDELGEVLKTLESSQWDDASIDQLLTAADASGDGQLQIEEFVKWVFAEEQAISAGAKGKFRLRISGCSRTELNGDYVQQSEFYYRRPIFHCIENERYLFYHGKRQQWQIFSRTGTYASARLKTFRAAHMPGDGITWAVWKTSKTSGKKNFVKESQMTCSAEPPLTPEEERAKAAQAILIDGKDVFKTMSYELGNRTVYHQRSERFLFYEEPKGMWKIGESCVFGKPSLFTSRPTDVYSPDLALWIDEAHGGKMAVVGLNDDDVPKGFKFGLKVRAVEDGWKDPDFPHNNDSIGAAASKYKGNRWLRAVSLHPHPALFADVEPADACQGTVGNCWLVAALSALAEFPSYIKNNLFVTKKISQSGKYQVKLFDGRSNRWEIIEIDDYLPCTGSGGDQPDLLFANIPDGKMCIALLEKAFAKMYGNWSALDAGFPEIAWFHTTSCKEVFYYSTTYLAAAPQWVVIAGEGIPVVADYWDYDKSRQRLGQLGEGAHFTEKWRIGEWIQFEKLDGDGPDEGWLKYYSNGKRAAKRTAANDICIMQSNVGIAPEEAMKACGASGSDKEVLETIFKKHSTDFVEPEEMWQKLLEYDQGNYLMASSASTSAFETSSGIVQGHAYSFLHALEIEGIRLVCCRNPWGNEVEWNGPWSDRHSAWKANPGIAEALNVDFQTEGTFWMDFEDEEEQAEDAPGEDGEDQDEDAGRPVTGCSGLFVDWHPARTMEEGIVLYPEKDYTFQKVPAVLLGGTYIGSNCWPTAGTWTIEYQAPATLYVWAAQGQFNGGVDEALSADGWTAEAAEGFCGGALSLNLWSKHFDTGSSCSIEITADTMIGGVIGTSPCVQF